LPTTAQLDLGTPEDPQVQNRPAANPLEGGLVLGMAIAPAAVGFVSLLMSVATILSGTGSIPRGLIVVLLAQGAAGFILTLNDRDPLLPSWISTSICSAVLLPLLALQVALLREPYVSWSRGSASPAVVATVVVGMIVVVGAVWAVAASWEHPDEAGLLFMPQALMIPALIAVHSTLMQNQALRVLGLVMLLTAAATALSWLLDPSARLFVPPVALAVEFVGLWITGHGPWFQATSGDVVRVLY
jgi:hypothetical protein